MLSLSTGYNLVSICQIWFSSFCGEQAIDFEIFDEIFNLHQSGGKLKKTGDSECHVLITILNFS